MASIELKAFTQQKDGESYSNQDRFAVNIGKRRFAVADGVSNSYHPEITAETLCHEFISGDYAIDDWPTYFKNYAYDNICSYWNDEVYDIESELDELDLEHATLKRQKLPDGASTFVGMEINALLKEISFYIVGDSCLFLVADDKPLQTFCTSQFIEQGNQRFYRFDRHTNAVVVNQVDKDVQWLSGKLTINSGFLFLMTDGAAKWFQDEMVKNHNVVNSLWQMDGHDQFELLVQSCREQSMMDDDITIILLKFDEGWDAEIVPRVIDVWEWYPENLIQLRQEKKASELSQEPQTVSESPSQPMVPVINETEHSWIVSWFTYLKTKIRNLWMMIFGQE